MTTLGPSFEQALLDSPVQSRGTTTIGHDLRARFRDHETVTDGSDLLQVMVQNVKLISFHGENDRRDALERPAGNRNDELQPVLLHHGKAVHNIGQYQGSTQISLRNTSRVKASKLACHRLYICYIQRRLRHSRPSCRNHERICAIHAPISRTKYSPANERFIRCVATRNRRLLSNRQGRS